MLVVLNLCMVLGLEGDEIVGFNRVAVWVKFDYFRVFFPGLRICAMWRLVLTITYCAVQAAKIAKVFARSHILRPIYDFKFVHGLGFRMDLRLM